MREEEEPVYSQGNRPFGNTMVVGSVMPGVDECVPPQLPPTNNIYYSIAQLATDLTWNLPNVHRNAWYRVLMFAGLSLMKCFRGFLVITHREKCLATAEQLHHHQQNYKKLNERTYVHQIISCVLYEVRSEIEDIPSMTNNANILQYVILGICVGKMIRYRLL